MIDASPGDASLTGPDARRVLSCPTIGPAIELGHVQNDELSELSGLAALGPWILAHNDNQLHVSLIDSGSGSTLFTMIPAAGEPLGNGDIEDIAVFNNQILVGDIGKNHAGNVGRVVRFTLPSIDLIETGGALRVAAETLTFSYQIPDAESMFADPRTGEIYIVTKENEPKLCALGAFVNGAVLAPSCINTNPTIRMPSAADIDPRGRYIVIRNESQAAIWLRQPGQSIADALRGEPCPFTTLENNDECNGEAIAFSADGRALFSASERSSIGGPTCPNTHLHQYSVTP